MRSRKNDEPILSLEDTFKLLEEYTVMGWEMKKKVQEKYPEHLKKVLLAKLDNHLKGLERLKGLNNALPKSKIMCYNFQILRRIMEICETYPMDQCRIYGMMPLPKKGDKKVPKHLRAVIVDVVVNKILWFRIKTAPKEKLQLIYEGQGEEKQKCVTDVAKTLLAAAQNNTYRFVVPTVIYEFHCGVGDDLAMDMLNLGVHVVAPKDKISPQLHQILSQQPKLSPVIQYPKKCLVDSTCLICLSSSMTNFEMKPSQDSRKHRYDPRNDHVCKEIYDFLEGKQVYITQGIYDHFTNILKLVATPTEKKRAETFFKRCKIIPDDPSERVKNMAKNKKIKTLHQNTYGTADKMGAVILSSNEAFFQAAKKSNVNLCVRLFKNYSVRLGVNSEFYLDIAKREREQGKYLKIKRDIESGVVRAEPQQNGQQQEEGKDTAQ